MPEEAPVLKRSEIYQCSQQSVCGSCTCVSMVLYGDLRRSCTHLPFWVVKCILKRFGNFWEPWCVGVA
jgi:hypothetical protein